MGSASQRLLAALFAAIACWAMGGFAKAQVPVKKVPIGQSARKLQIIPAPSLRSLSLIAAMSEAQMLRLEHVQDELELGAEQREKLKRVFQQHDEQARKAWEGLRDLPMQERLKKSAEIRQKSAERLEDLRKQALDVLLPEQRDKLKQIVFRMQAQVALANPRLLDQLGLDDEQKAALERLRDELAAKTRQLQREIVEKSLEVLTPEQRQQLEEMGSR